MFAKLEHLYNEYVSTYRDASGALPEMMQLKLVHTMNVVENARLIAQGEGFDKRTCEASIIAALLHDTGRYEQLKLYNTFRDADSVDHAVFSHDIVCSKKWLDDVADKQAILTAVLVHNRKDIPIDQMDSLTLACSKTVRDADKLDIFNVLEERVATTDWRNDNKAFWNLKTDAPPSPIVIQAIRNSQAVDYQHIQCLADFVLIQVGWMISGLEYSTSRKLCLERGHLEFRRSFLKQLTDDPCVDELCDLVLA